MTDPAADAIRRGDTARRAGRWKDAEAAYRAAWDRAQRPEIAGELGLAELALGKFLDAAGHLQRSLVEPKALTPAQRRRFAEGEDKAAREVAMVAIAVNPAEAKVFVDGQLLGEGVVTYQRFVAPGKHEARATLAGYFDEVWSFQAERGGMPMVPLHLEPKPSPAPPRLAATTPRALPVAAPARGVESTLRIAGTAAASGGVIAGAAFVIAAVAKGDDAQDRADSLRERRGTGACGYGDLIRECNELKTTLDARDALVRAAWGSFIASGVVGAVVVTSLWWAPSPGRSGVQVLPTAAANGGGLVLQGTW